MLTMVLSVLWFGHRLSGMQWVGVGLVFGGVGAEGAIARREKKMKEAAKLKGTSASSKTKRRESVSFEEKIGDVVEAVEGGVLGRGEGGVKEL